MAEKYKPTLLDDPEWQADNAAAADALLAINDVKEPSVFEKGPAGDYPEGRTPSIAELSVDPDYLHGKADENK